MRCDHVHGILDSQAISTSKAIPLHLGLCNDPWRERTPGVSRVTRHPSHGASGIRIPRQEGNAHSLVPCSALK